MNQEEDVTQEKFLYKELIRYGASEDYPFHMPGHKRRLGSLPDPYSIDITEIDGFDNLHHAQGLILEAEKRAAELYGSQETHFLVNGSSCGVLAAISACCRRGCGKLLMARASHKSAYHAVGLNGLAAEYLYPQKAGELNGPVQAGDVREALIKDREGPARIQAVFITSPTYEGIVSDVKSIAETVHEFDLPLIVDAAHGAHFGMHEIFPASPVKLGADLVIHSLHKTLPSLTQTALIHVNGARVDRRRLRAMLDTFQSSSPSYVLMAGMDECISMLRAHGKEIFSRWAENLLCFYERWGLSSDMLKEPAGGAGCTVKSRQILDHFHLLITDDPSRILICPDKSCMTASALYDILRQEYHLQSEMLSVSYVLMLSGAGDDPDGFERLSDALKQIDSRISSGKGAGALGVPNCGFSEKTGKSESIALYALPRPEPVLKITKAEDSKSLSVPLVKAAGCVSAEYLYLYPPGIPYLVPGERIGQDTLDAVLRLKTSGYALHGLSDYSADMIRVIEEQNG